MLPAIQSKSNVRMMQCSAIKSIPTLKASKVSNVPDMQYYIIHMSTFPLGQRFKLRKKRLLASYSTALVNSGFLERSLTDPERCFPFVKRKELQTTFNVFSICRKRRLACSMNERY